MGAEFWLVSIGKHLNGQRSPCIHAQIQSVPIISCGPGRQKDLSVSTSNFCCQKKLQIIIYSRLEKVDYATLYKQFKVLA